MLRQAARRPIELGPGDLRKVLPFEPIVTSRGRGWHGLEAARFCSTPAFELDQAVLTHHMLALFARPPDELNVRFEGVTRHIPPASGSIMLVPAGSPVRARSSGHCDELRAAMLAVNDELMAEGGGQRLAVESLANVLAVHLIRHAAAPRTAGRRADGALSQATLNVVVEYIDQHLDTDLTLARMAAAAHLSAYHFARRFKAATGMPPHQYVVARRIERAQQLLRESDLSLADVAASVGFSDQSQFTGHFKHVLGVTPRQFRTSARIA